MAKSLSQKPRNNRLSPRRIMMAANFLLLLILAFTSVYFFKQYQNVQNDQKLTEEQRGQKMVEEVAKVYALPQDEKPFTLVVADEAEFRKLYTIFDMAVKDDYLLIYQKAGLAILYRPSEEKVIKTGQVNIIKDLNVQLIGPADQAAAAEKTLAEKITTGFKITNKDPAVGTYSAIIVVDVTGKNADAAKQIADTLGASVGALPGGETAAAGADIVIVLASPAPPAPEPSP